MRIYCKDGTERILSESFQGRVIRLFVAVLSFYTICSLKELILCENLRTAARFIVLYDTLFGLEEVSDCLQLVARLGLPDLQLRERGEFLELKVIVDETDGTGVDLHKVVEVAVLLRS
jgi:hypothetical protein